MTWQTFIPPIVGGSIIGLAAVLMMWLNGRILGVSGFAGGLIAPGTSDRLPRLVFLIGVILTGAIAAKFMPSNNPGAATMNLAVLIPAGLAVGFGTRLGSGCTSGHGVCGIARLSGRSLTATIIFMTVAIATVYVTRHLMA